MAVQCGPILLTGQLGGISFYEMGGRYYARSKTSHSAERIKTDPAFAGTHHNSLDFATAVHASKLLRKAWAEIASPFSDSRITGRLNGAFFKVLRADTTHPCGSRTLVHGDLALLQGFEFNKDQVLSGLMPLSPAVAVNRAAGHVSVSLPSTIESFDWARSRAVIGIVCVNFKLGTHVAYRYECPIADFASNETASVVFQAPSCSDPACVVIVTFGIIRHEGPDTDDAGCPRAMSIVAVEGSVSGRELRRSCTDRPRYAQSLQLRKPLFMSNTQTSSQKRKKLPVNYVAHLNAVRLRIKNDPRLDSAHISLYYALFHVWNERRFQNPINVYRDEMMAQSRIRTRNRYAECLRELGEWGYIQYTPGNTSHYGSVIQMIAFDGAERDLYTSDDAGGKAEALGMSTGYEAGNPAGIEIDTDPGTGEPLTPLLYNINLLNDVKYKSTSPRSNDFVDEEKFNARLSQPSAGKNTSSAGEGAGRRPKSLLDVIAFFREQESSAKQAKKFYLYHEANGWTIGKGNAPVADWKARAEYWILSDVGKNSDLRPGVQHVEVDKEYSTPL